MPEQGLPIADAAQILGVSVDALRKRVQRRSVRSYKGTDGQWRVVLPDSETPETSPATETLSETSEDSETSAIIGTPDERFARVIEQAIAPYAARLEAVSREAGELRSRLEHAERERDDLRARLTASEDAAPPSETPAPPALSQREPEVFPKQRWPWWMRILGGK